MNNPIPSTIKSRLQRYALRAFAERSQYTALMQSADQLRSEIQRDEPRVTPLLARIDYLRPGAVRYPEFAEELKTQTDALEALQNSIAAKREEAERLQAEAHTYAQKAAQIGTVVNGIVRQLGTTRRELGIDYNDSPMPQPSTVIPVNNYRTGAA